MKGRLIIDSEIPFIRGVFEPFFEEVEYYCGGEITRERVHREGEKGAVGLVVRTRTKCDRGLLEDSGVRVVATATIGLDHIDTEWCKENGVRVFSAQGCNARAVAQWVFSSIEELKNRGIMSDGYTLGVVGVGNVGGEVGRMAREVGGVGKLLLNDPPRVEKEGAEGFSAIDELLENSNIITLHTPLDHTTTGMVDAEFLGRMKRGAVLLNSSRGELVVDSSVIENHNVHYCFDVWTGEPNINPRVLDACTIGTPHIAGYSRRGKARATTMVVRQLADFWGLEELMDWDCSVGMVLESPLGCDVSAYDRSLRDSPDFFEGLRTIR